MRVQMSFQTRLILLLSTALILGTLLFAHGQIDLFVTSWFFDGHDFDWRDSNLANAMHGLIHPMAITVWSALCLASLYAVYKKKSPKPALFLLLAMSIGPGIITNVILKDHWDRARPMQVTQFGGTKLFTPPLVMASQCDRNCSFVAGDPAMGFWFHSFGYLVAPQRRRKVFASGIGIGLAYGVLRIGMGAHFLSDVFFSGVVVLLTSLALHVLLFGKQATSNCWHSFIGGGASVPKISSATLQRQTL